MAKAKAKYTTLTELAAAFESGELDDSYWLMLDKGGCEISLCKASTGEEDENEIYDKCQALFRREYGNPVQEILALAGIRSEWC